MNALWKSLLLVSVAILVASCLGPPTPRYRGARPPGQRYSLDRPPPGNDPNLAADSRYVQQVQPPPTTAGDIADPQIDPGLSADPNVSTAPGPNDPTTADANPTADGTTPNTAPQTPTPPPAPEPPAEYPYGKPVPGSRGFVYSPYDPTAGKVDVQGFAPGTKVRCPYTGKVFRVP